METNTGIEMDTHCKSVATFINSCTTCFTIFQDLFSSKTKLRNKNMNLTIYIALGKITLKLN